MDELSRDNIVKAFKERGLAKGYWFHILLNTATVLLGFSTFLPLSYVRSYFGGHCVLYSNIRLLPSNETFLNVDIIRSSWGDTSNCDISVYFGVMATIHAFIWCWFFLMLIWQPSGEDQEIFLLDLAFLSHLVTCVMLLVSSSKITGGTRQWCSHLTTELERPGISPNVTTCAESEDLLWSVLGKKHKFYSFLVAANVCSWLLTITVLCQAYLCAYRLYKWNDNSTESKKSKTASNTYIAYDNEISDENI